MRRVIVCTSLVLLLFSLPAIANTALIDLTLKRGVGVRAAGMGGAGTALMNDGSALFYNPANLAQPGLSYTTGNPDTNKKLVDGSFSLIKLGYFGFGSWKMSDSTTDEIQVSTIGFGSRSSWMNWGVNFKTINTTFGGAQNPNWSSDIGLLARITPDFKIGLIAQDLLGSQNSPVPVSGRVGFGYTTPNGAVSLAGDVEYQGLNKMYTYLGLEANILQGLSVRGGLDRGEPTAGLTLDLSFFSFDYAALFAQNGQTIQRFETGIKFVPNMERPFSMIGPKEYALIDVSGEIKGGRSEYSFFGGAKPGLDSILTKIRRASKDGAIAGIMLRVGGLSGGLGGMAIAQEIRFELIRAREKGKKIVAFMENGATGDEYYLAAVADRIIAPPGAAVGGLGKSVGIYRLKGLFEKFGVDWQVFKQGKYKNIFDPYSGPMTNEQRQLVKALLADLYRKMITDIANDRNLPIEKVKKIGDGLIFTAREAKATGLIDDLGYYEDAKKIAAEVAGDKKEKAKIVDPQLVEPEEFFLARAFGVAVIEIDGEIVSGQGGENVIFGGDAIAAAEVYEAIKYAKEKKKVVIASIGNIGASGGYYIAAGADKIVADPSSLTGSIGVIGRLPIISRLLKKLEIETDVVKEGRHADMFYGLRKLTPEEKASIEKLQAENYQLFIQAVVDGRKLPTAEVEAAAQGKIYTGSQALELKLVDALGGFSDAVDLAKAEAKIGGEPRLIFYHQSSMFFNFGAGISESLGLKTSPWFFNLMGRPNLLQSQYN